MRKLRMIGNTAKQLVVNLGVEPPAFFFVSLAQTGRKLSFDLIVRVNSLRRS